MLLFVRKTLYLLATGRVLQGLDLNTTVIRLGEIRERISKFILEWIIHPDGPFHDPAGGLMNNSYIDDHNNNSYIDDL